MSSMASDKTTDEIHASNTHEMRQHMKNLKAGNKTSDEVIYQFTHQTRQHVVSQ